MNTLRLIHPSTCEYIPPGTSYGAGNDTQLAEFARLYGMDEYLRRGSTVADTFYVVTFRALLYVESRTPTPALARALVFVRDKTARATGALLISLTDGAIAQARHMQGANSIQAPVDDTDDEGTSRKTWLRHVVPSMVSNCNMKINTVYMLESAADLVMLPGTATEYLRWYAEVPDMYTLNNAHMRATEVDRGHATPEYQKQTMPPKYTELRTSPEFHMRFRVHA